jgi:hypothetical protein
MTIDLSDPDGDTSLTLWQAQTAEVSTLGAVDATSVQGEDSENTFLTSIEQSGDLRYSGVVTGNRLCRQAGYSSDPVTALAEWVLDAERYVDGAQGTGYDLTDTRTGRTRRGVIESFEWTRAAGAPLQVEYNLGVTLGEGADPTGVTAPDPIGDATVLSVGGETIDTYREIQVSKSEETDAVRRAFADDPSDNDVLTDGGATREITVVGRVSGVKTDRLAFDDALRSTIGQDEFVTVTEPFTGRTFEGMINDFESSDEAGITRLGDFALTVVEGAP